MSTIQVDDTDSRFTYKDNFWTAGGEAGEFNQTSHSSNTAGAQVVFGPFQGTSIAVFSTVGTSQTKTHIFVDSGAQSSDLPAESNNEVTFQSQIYSASNLDPTKQHSLQINLLDAGPFTIDFVVIGSTSTIVAASLPTTTSLISSQSSSPSKTPSATTTITSLPGITTSTSGIRTTSSKVISSVSQTPSSGNTPTLTSSHSQTQGSVTSGFSTTSTGPSATMVGSLASTGLNTAVIGSVIGAIACLAIIVIGTVLYLRRKRTHQSGRTVPNNKTLSGSGWSDSESKSKRLRPSLHLSIPTLPGGRRISSSILPTHRDQFNNNNASASTSSLQPSSTQKPTIPAPAFLAEEPVDSPIFDIKQRPVSGSTMTTRVTVGTTINHRASVPDSVYHSYYGYSYPETPVSAIGPPPPVPPVPPMPPMPTIPIPVALSTKATSKSSPTETNTESVLSTSHVHTTMFGSNALDSISGFGNGTETFGTSIFPPSMLDPGASNTSSQPSSAVTGSAPRPLPHTPTDMKRALSGAVVVAGSTNVSANENIFSEEFQDGAKNQNYYSSQNVQQALLLPYSKYNNIGNNGNTYNSNNSSTQNSYPRFLPTTPMSAETVVHEDGGVRLDFNTSQNPRSRRELPPPYRDYGL